MFLVSSTTPPLEALYALPPAVPSRPSILASVTMEPRTSPTTGCWSICPMTCLAMRYVPVRLTEMTHCHSPCSSSRTGPPPATPAAFTRPSIRPNVSVVDATRSTTEASSLTSTCRNDHDPVSGGSPSCSVQSTHSARSAPITVAPSLSRRSAHAKPIPEAAPVTTTTLSLRPLIESSPRLLLDHRSLHLIDRVHVHKSSHRLRPTGLRSSRTHSRTHSRAGVWAVRLHAPLALVAAVSSAAGNPIRVAHVARGFAPYLHPVTAEAEAIGPKKGLCQ